MKKGDLIHIAWMDAETHNEWTDEAVLLKKSNSSLLCETVGFLVKKATPKSPVFIVASSRSKADGKYEYNAITKIPKAWVKEIEQLKEKENGL